MGLCWLAAAGRGTQCPLVEAVSVELSECRNQQSGVPGLARVRVLVSNDLVSPLTAMPLRSKRDAKYTLDQHVSFDIDSGIREEDLQSPRSMCHQ